MKKIEYCWTIFIKWDPFLIMSHAVFIFNEFYIQRFDSWWPRIQIAFCKNIHDCIAMWLNHVTTRAAS